MAKITVHTKALKAALAAVRSTAKLGAQRANLEDFVELKALGGIVTLRAATNVEEIKVEVSAIATGDCSYSIFAPSLAKICRVPAGEIEIESVFDDEVKGGDRLQATIRQTVFALQTLTTERKFTKGLKKGTTDFPHRYDIPTEAAIDYDAEEIDFDTTRFKIAVAAASTDESRPILATVLLAAGGDYVATNSFWLSLQPGDVKLAAPLLIPRWLAPLIPDVGVVKMTMNPSGIVSARRCFIAIGDARISFWSVEGKFPGYEGLIPGDNNRICSFDRAELLRTITGMNVYIPAGDASTRWEIEGDSSTIKLMLRDERFTVRSTLNLATPLDGEKIVFGVNGSYLAAALRTVGPFEDGTVRFEFADEPAVDGKDSILKPVMLKGHKGDALLMPVRLTY